MPYRTPSSWPKRGDGVYIVAFADDPKSKWNPNGVIFDIDWKSDPKTVHVFHAEDKWHIAGHDEYPMYLFRNWSDTFRHWRIESL